MYKFLRFLLVFFAVATNSCLAQDDLSSLIDSVFNTSINFTPNPGVPVVTPEPIFVQPTPSPIFVQPTPSPIFAQPTPSPIFPESPRNLTVNPNTGVVTTGCAIGYDCVPYYLCRNNSIVKDGEGLLDVRFDDDKPKECQFLQQCCGIKDRTTIPVVTPRPPPDGCGFRNTDGIDFRITGDKNNETEYGEFPWQIAILREERGLDKIVNIYECGGSLIHPQVVLTAAHCVATKSVEALRIRAGEWDTQTKSELLPDQDRDVSEIIVHEHFYKGGLFNDIALIFLKSPFDLAANVKPICLPPANANFNGVRCYATGWGKTSFGQLGKYSVIMKKIDLPIIPNKQCQEQLRKTRLGDYFELHPSFICAGGEVGKDTCKGDGGSPLVCPIPGTRNQYYQVGIVAWGIGCGDAIPGVYVNVPILRAWIDDQLAYKRIDSSFFTP